MGYGTATYGSGAYGNPTLVAVDTTAPVVNLTSPLTQKISDEPGKDSYTYSFSASEAITAWKVKLVSSGADPHTAGEMLDGGGFGIAEMGVDGTGTWIESTSASAVAGVDGTGPWVDPTADSVLSAVDAGGTWMWSDDGAASVAAGTPITGTVTYQQLVDALSGAEGSKRIKVFVRDAANNWST